MFAFSNEKNSCCENWELGIENSVILLFFTMIYSTFRRKDFFTTSQKY